VKSLKEQVVPLLFALYQGTTLSRATTRSKMIRALESAKSKMQGLKSLRENSTLSSEGTSESF
jgi:hypothetical protein